MNVTIRLGTLAVALLLAIGCSHQADLSRPASQDNFGVQMARMNLWREAMFRFERAIQLNPGDAQAHNNLAVAYEANGDFEKARKEYLEALKLDRTNAYIQKNYSRFVEFLSRNKKRQTGPKSASTPLPGVIPSATSTTVINGGQPDRPIGSEPPPSGIAPPGAPPSDRPQPQPQPPPAKPPGGAV
ncbi:MAG: hypothetical protein QOK37_3520 [Thermoanaerobaculia bacterium]|jgi:tetratricopeptide (TPR) repeat protein|nr:hypothetical protein [Thermoanaerobaculia bacterium]